MGKVIFLKPKSPSKFSFPFLKPPPSPAFLPIAGRIPGICGKHVWSISLFGVLVTCTGPTS